MTNFVCLGCGYKFNMEKSNRCPYCDGDKIEEEKSAEQLIDSVQVE